MKLIHKVLMIGSMFLISCSSPTLESAASGVNSHPAMWLATNKQSKVYLLGSTHVLPPQVKWYGYRIQQAFNSSDVLFLESLHNETTKEKYLAYSKKYGFLANGKVISDYLTQKEYTKYQEIVKALGLDRYYADRMKPWLFLLTVNGHITKESSRYGVDTLLEQEAVKRSKKLKSLESIEEALSSLSQTILSEDIQQLKKLLKNEKVDKEAQKKQIDLLISWTLGDIERTERLISQGMQSKKYYNLIIQRNNKWYPKIKKELKSDKTTMIVVGLAHLIGKANIIDKLKRSGYKVKRVQ